MACCDQNLCYIETEIIAITHPIILAIILANLMFIRKQILFPVVGPISG